MKKINTDIKKINNLLTRNTEEIFVAKHLRTRLSSGDCLRIKLGIDPTGPKLHLGRTIPLWKLRDFQDLGHQVVLIIGDFTALIGDPSDKLSKRPFLTMDQVRENMKDYKKQLGKVIDIDKVEWRYNSEWLQAMTFIEVAKLAESFSVQQMLARRNFKERYNKGLEISIRELLYPLMQGYDSAAIKCDVEVGGIDQLFNLKAGRVIQQLYNQPPQDIMAFAMLEGSDGRKMSTSWGNVINITDEPPDMYGKVMSIIDDLIVKYFYLTTRLPAEEIKQIEKDLTAGANPRDHKARLAYEIVALYHSRLEAKKAADNFNLIHRAKQPPENIPNVRIPKDKKQLSAVELITWLKLAASKSEARRLVEQKAVQINKIRVKDWNQTIKLTKNAIVQVGNRRFVKLV
ncbi:MAG: tyrosine--tRNA ligase [Patescibacteria group bacterium]